MSVLTCPRCGASNTPPARFCSTCGTSLITVPAPTVPPMGYTPPPAQQYYPYQYPANSWEVARTNKTNNTLTGLLLLVIGVLIAWIPFAGFIGGIVGFIGGILVYIGREPFGADHVRNTTLALKFGVVNVFLLPFGSGGFWTLYFGTGVLLFTGFLAAIPAALYGTAFYLARERIVRHEIPPPMTQREPGKPPW